MSELKYQSSSDPLEYQMTQLVAALCALVGDARQSLEAGDDPTEIVRTLTRRIESAAGELKMALTVIAQHRQREATPSRRN